MDIEKIIDEEFQAISHLLEKCWDGYQRNYDVPKGEQGSCEIKKEAAEDAGEHVANKAVRDGTTNAEALKAFLNDPPIPDNEVRPWLERHGLEPEETGYKRGANVDDTHLEEGEICDAGISYVIRTDPGGKDIKRGKDKDKDGKGDLQNWSARAAQIASKYCKDPDYGKGRGKDAKNEDLSDKDEDELAAISKELAKASKMHKGQSARVKKIARKLDEKKKNCGCGQDPCKTYGVQEGKLSDWEAENWTHSDGTPCGGGKKDGSNSRCKPASKWKTMSKGEKAADNKKKKAGTKSGKQYVKSNHPVTKSHTKRNEGKSIHTAVKLRIAEAEELDEKKKKPCKKAKGKKFVKRVNGRCRSYGQSGKAKDGGARIRPGTKKGDAYCARSAKIKKCKNPPCANDLSRKKWKCRGSKSMKESEQ